MRKISLALVLMTVAGVATARDQNQSFFGFDFRMPSYQPQAVQAPEIDPASAMAGLTMLAGGLAVLRGRRSKISKE